MNNQETNHIYPIFDCMLGRADKEELLKQHGLMIWFYRTKRFWQKYHRHCSGT